MLSRFPHEVRLKVFHNVFAQSGYREVIRVEDTAQGITYRFDDKWDERKYGGGVSCLDTTTIGSGVATAAAEALYQSEIMFAVDAKILCAFLHSCPLSRAVEPAGYIETVLLYMDEDPKFNGDGEDGQALRKGDWVDLDSDVGDDTMTEPGHRTQLMRQCWRAILKMPKLNRFEFRVMPSQGKASANDIQRWEIRDIIPMHFRLCLNNIDAAIYLRTWEAHLEPTNVDKIWLEQKRDYVVDDTGLRISHMDLSTCVPYNCNELMGQERFVIPPEHHDHAIRNCVAVQDLIDRLKSDKDYEITSEGDIRRKRNHASHSKTIERAS